MSRPTLDLSGEDPPRGRTAQSRYSPPPRHGRAKQRAIVVGALPNGDLAELQEPLRTAGVAVVGELIQRRDQLHPNLYLGPGKVAELKRLIDSNLVATTTSDPRQERNLEKQTGVPVIVRRILAVIARTQGTPCGLSACKRTPFLAKPVPSVPQDPPGDVLR